MFAVESHVSSKVSMQFSKTLNLTCSHMSTTDIHRYYTANQN